MTTARIVWNYDYLQAVMARFSYRTDLTTTIPEFIALGEAGLNRELDAIETDAELDGESGSRELDLSSISVVTPLKLFILDSSGNETELTEKTDGDFPYSTTSGAPRLWAFDDDHIDFDCLLDSDYTFRLRFIERFSLSDRAPTNWLLTNHPDVYLAACMVWGCAFMKAFSGDGGDTVQNYQTVLDNMLPKLKRQLRRNRTGLMSIDPALLGRRRVNLTTLS